jgi:hypothetical protein
MFAHIIVVVGDEHTYLFHVSRCFPAVGSKAGCARYAKRTFMSLRHRK